MAEGDLKVRIGVLLEGLKKGLKQAESHLEAFGKGAQKIGKALSIGVTAPLAGIGIASIKMAANMEQSQIAFTSLLKSADKAKEHLQALEKFAARTPFQLRGIQTASRRLMAYGFQAKQIIPIMTNVGDAISAMGGGEPEINRLILALGQMHAKGKIMSQEMRQLTDLGIAGWEMLAEKIGVSIPEVMKMVEKGMVDSASGIETILEGIHDRFGGMMEVQSKTISGLWSTLRDNIEITLKNIGMEIVKTLNLKNIIEKTVKATQEISDWFVKLNSSTKTLIISMGLAAAATGPLLLAFGKLAVGIVHLNTLLKTSVLLLTGKVGLAGAFIAGGVYIGLFLNKIAESIGALERLEKALVNFFVEWDRLKEKASTGEALLPLPGPGPIPEHMKKFMKEIQGKVGPGQMEFMGPELEPLAPKIFQAIGGKGLPEGVIDRIATGWEKLQDAIRRSGPPIKDFQMKMENLVYTGEPAMAKLQEGMRQIKFESELFGSSFDETNAKLNLVSSTMQELVRVGTTPAIEKARELSFTYHELLNQLTFASQEQTESMNSLTFAWENFKNQLITLPEIGARVIETYTNIFQTFSQGIASSIAQMIVYGQSLKDMMKQILKQILAMVISTLFQIGIQYLLAKIFAVNQISSEASAKIASYAAITFASVFAANAASGIIGATGQASLAVSTMLAEAAIAGAAGAGVGKGIAQSAGMAEGGFVRRPTMRLFGEAGPEAVVPLDRWRELQAGGGGRRQTINIYLDNRLIAQAAAEGMPDVLNAYGVN